MRKVAVFTGTRAEYGLLSRLMRLLRDDPATELQVIAAAAHFAPEFGETWRAIEADGMTIAARVEMLLASDSRVGVAKSLGLGTIGMADALERLRPDVLVILGDRFEALAAAQVALILGIPIAHVHGGEITAGAYDDAIRHAISKMATWHFVAAAPYRTRVIRMGTPPDRVFTVGAPGLDELVAGAVVDPAALAGLGLALDGAYALATWHPPTATGEDPVAGLSAILTALDAWPDLPVIWTYPNADNGGRAIIAALEDWVAANRARAVAVPSLGFARYRAALAGAAVVLGNSSSGVIEAPSFGVPVLNIGDRQAGRLAAASVRHVAAEPRAIQAALENALQPAARAAAAQAINPYGQGRAAEAMLTILRDAPIPCDLPFHDGPDGVPA
ncbi:UDP-N-acetylglucosamine 2-epimerase [Tabrizicola sp.]|uniref:UDP-N-acetylglucosamine 2-epimerase n=1 Tax=Tabrizicola sp. TaxID=2005166 RepID=UPI00261C1C77|nr:UDP-N-acetylglucosamine 2-epimerase [Tabrizicola sp.]MDM7932019.1 UDP-N-acetylglucosamine 2-epimerase [Tabrizicola sp.]